uniref:Uncharacterized protein n=1 Tax=viral metagenome TaxID=1070528 RepID=A0A6C0I1B1_9ZZZZ
MSTETPNHKRKYDMCIKGLQIVQPNTPSTTSNNIYDSPGPSGAVIAVADKYKIIDDLNQNTHAGKENRRTLKNNLLADDQKKLKTYQTPHQLLMSQVNAIPAQPLKSPPPTKTNGEPFVIYQPQSNTLDLL